LKLELFSLLFQRQGNPESVGDLLKSVKAVGLDNTRADEILAGDEFGVEVRQQQK
jgi:hypothetical protein